MSTDRRRFLTGAGALATTMLTGSAFAQDAIQAILNSPRRGNWDDQFDARASLARLEGRTITGEPVQ